MLNTGLPFRKYEKKVRDLLTLIIFATFLSTMATNGKKIKNTEIQTIKLCFDSGSGKLFFVKRSLKEVIIILKTREFKNHSRTIQRLFKESS